MKILELTLKSSAELDELVRRFEVFRGAGRRRDWPAEDMGRIAAESFEPGATVSAVARRHALSPRQLFTLRRELRKAADAMPAFVQAVVAPEPAPTLERTAQPSRPKRRTRQALESIHQHRPRVRAYIG